MLTNLIFTKPLFYLGLGACSVVGICFKNIFHARDLINLKEQLIDCKRFHFNPYASKRDSPGATVKVGGGDYEVC